MTSRFCVLFAAIGFVSCSSISSSDGHGGSLLPEMAEAHYSIDISLGDTDASAFAMYFQPNGIDSIQFTQGETLQVDGTPLTGSDLIGTSYGATVPLVDPGALYTFTLKVPGKGSYAIPLIMPAAATFTVPANNRIFPVSSSVAIAWTGVDPNAEDEIDMDFKANGDGVEATITVNPPAGSGTAAISSSELASIYQKASGSVGGTVLGTLTLKRGHTRSASPPFASGDAKIDRELDQVTIALTK